MAIAEFSSSPSPRQRSARAFARGSGAAVSGASAHVAADAPNVGARSDDPRAVDAQAIDPLAPANGSRRSADGAEYIYYDGYWIRYYRPLDDSLASRKRLIDNLTRRAFHHTEPGINTPGERLEAARTAWQNETDPALKRVNAAMLAGALFNRATDIFTAIVELEEKGVRISRSNELMKACGNCFKEALELGKSVRHHSGEEGIDELWGEPFRAFTLPIASYYETRLIKVAQTMANIDEVATGMKLCFRDKPEFEGLLPLVDTLAEAARHECETMKADACIFEIWPRFVAACEALGSYAPPADPSRSQKCEYVFEEALRTVTAGRDLINWVARARVPMPHSTRRFHARCDALSERLASC
jgi:hypothetical protein